MPLSHFQFGAQESDPSRVLGTEETLISTEGGAVSRMCSLGPYVNFSGPQTEGRASHSSGNSEPTDCLKRGCGLLFVSLTPLRGSSEDSAF